MTMAPPPPPPQRQHFLVATYPAQGNINPALHLAKRLAGTAGAIVTFSTAVSAHRRMFPSNNDDDDGAISYIPFSDGYDNGFSFGSGDANDYLSQFKSEGSRTLAAVARSLAAAGRPVTCIIYTFFLPWAAEVARQLAIPSVLYWIQPATVFAIYYHYFHGFDAAISPHTDDPLFTVALPGLPALQIRDLPSLLTTSSASVDSVLPTFRELFETLDEEEEKGSGRRARVLMNTCEALEADAIAAVGGKLEVIPIGPLLPFSFMGGGGEDGDVNGGDMIKPEEGKGYMEWLNSKAERSVVYVSFGSMAVLSKRQVEEILSGLEESGRPYLWVLRRDCRWEGVEFGGELGMVVEWCSRLKVLSHPSIGCFVTHCGWNSTLESLVRGVPTVGVPQRLDQLTIARLAETTWGTGVRGMVDAEAVLESKELRRCMEVVMGEGEGGDEVRRAAATWRERAIQAVAGDGSSHLNLASFLEEVSEGC